MMASAAVLAGGAAGYDSLHVQEYRLKTGFLYNLTQFVEWPLDAFAREDAPLSVCVFGEDPFGDALEQIIRQRKAAERAAAIVRLRANGEPRGCHLLFLSENRSWQLAKLQARIANASVLTVGEGENFTDRGGIVGMVMDEDRVRLDVNVTAAARTAENQLSVARHRAAHVRTAPGSEEVNMPSFFLTTALRYALAVALVSSPAMARAEESPGSDPVVAGRVTDGLTGDPVAGAKVEALGTDKRVEADGKGHFVLRHLPAGRVTLVVSLSGYESERADLLIGPGTTSLEIVVVPSIDRMASAQVELLAEAQQRALDQQRIAPNLTTVVAADQLGRFPDGNAAEALNRVAGVSIRLDRGEGHDVLVRGASPRLNSVTLNGERLPSTHGQTRSVDLDVIPADLLQTVEVVKTSLPSTDGDGIGGSVSLSMGEIPRHSLWTVSFAGGHDELTHDPGQGSGAASGGGRLLHGRIGLFAAASGSSSSRGIDAVRARYSGALLPTSGFASTS